MPSITAQNAIKKIGVSLLLLLTACGKVDHEVKGTTKVEIEIAMEFEKLEKYFTPVCEEELPEGSEEEIKNCVYEKIGNLLDVAGG